MKTVIRFKKLIFIFLPNFFFYACRENSLYGDHNESYSKIDTNQIKNPVFEIKRLNKYVRIALQGECPHTHELVEMRRQIINKTSSLNKSLKHILEIAKRRMLETNSTKIKGRDANYFNIREGKIEIEQELQKSINEVKNLIERYMLKKRAIQDKNSTRIMNPTGAIGMLEKQNRKKIKIGASANYLHNELRVASKRAQIENAISIILARLARIEKNNSPRKELLTKIEKFEKETGISRASIEDRHDENFVYNNEKIRKDIEGVTKLLSGYDDLISSFQKKISKKDYTPNK